MRHPKAVGPRAFASHPTSDSEGSIQSSSDLAGSVELQMESRIRELLAKVSDPTMVEIVSLLLTLMTNLKGGMLQRLALESKQREMAQIRMDLVFKLLNKKQEGSDAAEGAGPLAEAGSEAAPVEAVVPPAPSKSGNFGEHMRAGSRLRPPAWALVGQPGVGTSSTGKPEEQGDCPSASSRSKESKGLRVQFFEEPQLDPTKDLAQGYEASSQKGLAPKAPSTQAPPKSRPTVSPSQQALHPTTSSTALAL